MINKGSPTLKILAILTLFIFSASNVLAVDNSLILSDTEDEDFKALKLKRPRKNYNLDEDEDLIEKNLSLKMVDENLGIQLGNYHTLDDSTRMSFLFHINADLKDMFEVTSFEFIYAKKMKNYWWESSFSMASGNFDEITENNEVALGATDEDLLAGTGKTMTFATGIAHRSTLIQEFIDAGDYFETVSAMASYNIFSESVVGDGFSGFGMKADLGVHKRITPSYHFGLRMSYFLASVQRSAKDKTERTASRSLMLHWITIGADLSFYF